MHLLMCLSIGHMLPPEQPKHRVSPMICFVSLVFLLAFEFLQTHEHLGKLFGKGFKPIIYLLVHILHIVVYVHVPNHDNGLNTGCDERVAGPNYPWLFAGNPYEVRDTQHNSENKVDPKNDFLPVCIFLRICKRTAHARDEREKNS